jgi:thioredoxin reductase
LIEVVDRLDETVCSMAKDTTGSDVGTGGMETKLTAARIATLSGADMVIANANRVEILWDTVAREIEGGESVQALWLKNVKTGKKERLEVDGVFVAVGIIPDSGLVSGLADCDGRGYVIAGEDGASSLAGLFVAGDIRTKKLRQIITAAADGANAITSVQEYLLKMKIESQ